mmetsp:Transcript_25517/g.19270  ORF Transcript_25517/g.19270 Transcript_25517/m.19270 type:complete len:210 (-) Transcript_25517:308-937(-)
MYNTFVTAFAVGGFCVWDQDVAINNSPDSKLLELLFPFLYRHTRDNEKFTLVKFVMCVLISMMHSFVVFAFPMMIYDEFMTKGGKDLDMWSCSLLGYFSVVHLHYSVLIMFLHNWTLWNLIYIGGSYMVFFFSFQFIHNNFAGPIQYRLPEIAYSNLHFWILNIFFVFLMVAPLVFFYRLYEMFFPSVKQLLTFNLTTAEEVSGLLKAK